MSRVTAVPIDVHPSGAQPSTVTCGAAWVYGSWVQVIASAGANLHLAGVVLGDATATQFEIEIGIGGAGVESGIHTFRSTLGNAGSDSQSQFSLFPVPLGGITSGDRVSVRARASSAFATFNIGLATYSSLSDTDHLTSEQMRSAPAGANSASITPSSTAWDYSTWVELFSGTTVETCLLAIAANAPVGGVEIEYEIGFGAASSEVGKTIIRTSQGTSSGLGPLRLFALPAALPIPPNTRVAVRMRKSGTSTTAHAVAMIYLNDTDLNTVGASASESITVADVVTAQLTSDIYKTVFETITVAESVSLRPSVLLVQVAEIVGVTDDASTPLGTSAYERIFVREYVQLAPNTLVVRVSEAITVTESPLYRDSDGVPGQLAPQPPASTAAVVDYWLTGI